MAAAENPPCRLSQNDLSNGHQVDCLISVQSLAARQTWPCTVNFSCECKVYPSSWTLEIMFTQVQERCTFNCFLSLRRNDSFDILLKAHVSVSFLDINEQIIRFRRTICTDWMSPDQKIEGSITDGRLSSLKYLNSEDTNLQITISIHSCHSLTNLEPMTREKLKLFEKSSSDDDADDEDEDYY